MFVQEENKAGYIYYVNKNTGEHQNDNQKLVELLNVIRDENYCEIKYAAYRCASKLWILKQSLYSKLKNKNFLNFGFILMFITLQL